MPLTMDYTIVMLGMGMAKWGYTYIACVAMYLCQDWGTALQLKEVLNELAIIMWLSLPLPVATQCKLHTLNGHSTSHSDSTSKVYEAKSKMLYKTIKEQPTPVEGTVKGNTNIILCPSLRLHDTFPCPGCVPAWLSGRLLRNGPGMFKIGDTKYKHWFDGQALLHSFTIVNG